MDDESDASNNLEIAIDGIFFIDILINFISAFETTDKNVEFRLPRIAFAYLR